MSQTVVSHVLATDHVVPDRDRWWEAVTSRAALLHRLGAHHVVAYAALRDPERVFVTMGLRHRDPLEGVLRSRAVLDWFDATGVEEIPPLFAGSVVEKIAVVPEDAAPPHGAHEEQAHHGAVVVAAITEVPDVELLRTSVHAHLDRFRSAGVRKVWLYRALDVGREVMVLQEVASEEQAQRWLDHPDASVDWMDSAGVGVYPPLFVGRLLRVLHLDPAEGAATAASTPPALPHEER
ncbi:MAG TPA: hypothetical protein VFJ94_09115 [Intrasporangium sp.]|uniref:hypothetical protein n=1 Tax=Intrasporangium sp. TaxID=1925024 RepID=UPI002D76623E|nr:hypothetical protein [Intrasporangium sp.]HET7398670.1 hypothetical protein [Intrasporangium sp.]